MDSIKFIFCNALAVAVVWRDTGGLDEVQNVTKAAGGA